MKFFFFCLGVAFSLPALTAETTRVRKIVKAAPVARTTRTQVPTLLDTPTTQETVRLPKSREIFLSMGPGFAVYKGKYHALTESGSVGFTVNTGLVTRAYDESPLYVGLDLSLSFWNFETKVSTISLDAIGIHALPTAYYKFDIDREPSVHPYFGVSMGPNFYVSKTTSLTTNASESQLSLYFELLFRPGVEITIANNMAFSFEPKFGMLRTEFIFIPQINAVMAL